MSTYTRPSQWARTIAGPLHSGILAIPKYLLDKSARRSGHARPSVGLLAILKDDLAINDHVGYSNRILMRISKRLRDR